MDISAIQGITHALNDGRARDALELCRELERSHPGDLRVEFAVSCALIDIGDALDEVDLVEEGIRRHEALRSDARLAPSAGMMAYNLGNGYATRRRLTLDADAATSPHQLSLGPDTRAAKVHFQQALLGRSSAPEELRGRLHTNYGSCLLELGRLVEAVDQFELATEAEPNHPVAAVKACRALLWQTGLLSRGQDAHLLELKSRIDTALANRDRLVSLAGPGIVATAEEIRAEIVDFLSRLGGVRELEARMQEAERHVAEDHDEPAPEAHKWASGRLFLCTHARLRESSRYWRDEAFFKGLHQALGADEAGFNDLTLRLNDMKQSYATARYLLTHGEEFDHSELTDLTLFAKSENDADWGLGAGLIKASYRTSADVLDKSAGFLNRLFAWGIEEKRVTFTSIWWKKGKKRELLPEAMNVIDRNPYVRALFDISLDWDDEELNQGHRDLRNALTHRYVPLYLEAEGAEHLTPSAIQAAARYMLRTARAVILSIVGTVEKENALRFESGRSEEGGEC